MNLISQKHLYDCGVACVYNVLKQNHIEIDYKDLEKDLKTTTLWGTLPKHISSVLDVYKQEVFWQIWIILVDGDKFYLNDEDRDDYGHYINIVWKENDLYKVFDPYYGKFHLLTKDQLYSQSQNVLVGKKTRYDRITFWNTFDFLK